jgi:hypothetical protein
MLSHALAIDNRRALTNEVEVCYLLRQVATGCTVLCMCKRELFLCVVYFGFVSYKLALLCVPHAW